MERLAREAPAQGVNDSQIKISLKDVKNELAR